MSEIYPIIYFIGKLNEVFPIVINVSTCTQVSSAVKMLISRHFHSFLKMFSAQQLLSKNFLDTEVSRK